MSDVEVVVLVGTNRRGSVVVLAKGIYRRPNLDEQQGSHKQFSLKYWVCIGKCLGCLRPQDHCKHTFVSSQQA